MALLRRTRPRLLYRGFRHLSTGFWRLHTAIAFVVLACRDPERARTVWVMVTLPSGARRRFHLRDVTQAAALVEVLVRGDYRVDCPHPVHSIVDLGANAGQATLFFRDRFPGADILAVEANPDTARLTSLNFGGDPKVAIVTAAVTDHDGTAQLTSAAGHSWGSNVVHAWASPTSDTRTVESLTLGSLLRRHGLSHVDLLKVDIEGAEILALTADDSLAKVRCAIGEVHPGLLDKAPETVLHELEEHGRFDRAWLHRPEIFVLQRSSTPANDPSRPPAAG